MMICVRKIVFLLFAMFFLSQCLYAENLLNGDFESFIFVDDINRPADWNSTNYASVHSLFFPNPNRGDTTNWNEDILNDGLSSKTGQYFLVLSTGNYEDEFGQDPKSATCEQLVYIGPNQTLSGYYFYGTCDWGPEYLQFNDYGEIRLVPEDSELDEIELVRKCNHDPNIGRYGSMDGWEPFSSEPMTADNAGYYTIVLKVEDMGDAFFVSYFALDGLEISYAGSCTPQSSSQDEYIKSVILKDIENIDTGYSQGGYADYTDMNTVLLTGREYLATIEVNNIDANDKFVIWMDWNLDGSFSDPCEIVVDHSFETNDVQVIEAYIYIPSDANIGQSRMRIMVTSSSQPHPCMQSSTGETEDYAIHISPRNRADIVGPDGVGLEDLAAVINQWLLHEIDADIAGDLGQADGFVDFRDFAAAKNSGWSQNEYLDLFCNWLESSAVSADIAPYPDGDKVVNILDLAMVLKSLSE